MKNRKTTICIFTALLLAAAPGCRGSFDQTSDTQTITSYGEDDSPTEDDAIRDETGDTNDNTLR